MSAAEVLPPGGRMPGVAHGRTGEFAKADLLSAALAAFQRVLQARIDTAMLHNGNAASRISKLEPFQPQHPTEWVCRCGTILQRELR